MRLIDADAQYDRLADELSWLMNFGDDVYLAVGEAIRNQPTAYDIDKVVEKMEEIEDKYSELSCSVNDITMVREYIAKEQTMALAIEIVKGE